MARAASACGRCWASWRTSRSRARAHAGSAQGAAAVELGHNFSLVHDDIEDGDVERRHRPTLWAVHGVPQAINTGDLIFSLSRVALHRLTDLGFPDKTVLRLMRLYDETCVMLCEGQYIDIETSTRGAPMTVDLYFDMIGRKTAALIAGSIEAGALLATDDERGDRPLPPLRLGTGPRRPAQRRPARRLGRGAEDGQGPDGSWNDTRRRCRSCTRSSTPRPEDLARLTQLTAVEEPTEAEIAETVAILERSGAEDFTRAEAQRWRDECLAELEALTVVEPGGAREAQGHHRRRSSARRVPGGATPRPHSARPSSSAVPTRPRRPQTRP